MNKKYAILAVIAFTGFPDVVLAEIVPPQQRELTATNRYLHLPVTNDAPKVDLTLAVGGVAECSFDIELAEQADIADWWAFIDISAWHGETLTVTANELSNVSLRLDALEQSDEIKGAVEMYHEAHRPQFHFSTKRGWINDPNGLVFHDGIYHLFYQHNPFGWKWGNMHWGHATSPDLVHWTETGDALHPDAMGTMFSGSGVVDWNNSSGLGKDGRPPLAFFYTAAGDPFTQCLAISNDGGRTLEKFPGNPILGNITPGNRDPKVIWHEPTERWIMTLYVGHPLEEKDEKGKPKRRETIQFFNSTDLKDWTFLSEIEGYYECPDFFELPVDGDPEQRKWVLTAANSDYQVGSFDGKTFTPETPILKGVHGQGFYAAQTYSDISESDGRRIQISWMRAPTPGMPFNNCMSLPLELQLVSTAEGPRLIWTPARALEKLRARSHELPAGEIAPGGENPLASVRTELLELEIEIDPGGAESLNLDIRGTPFAIDLEKHFLKSGDLTAPLLDEGERGTISLHVYCDRTLIEIFADGGRTYMTIPAIAEADNLACSLTAAGGEAQIVRLTAHELESAW